MPHVPRGYAPTFGEPPEKPAAAGGEEKRPARQRLGLGVISPRTYQPDPDAVVKSLFGKEVEADGDTGELVYTNRP